MSAEEGTRRRVADPHGGTYEVTVTQKDWKLGTGSIVLDAAAVVWGLVRQARRKEWVVSVKQPDSKAEPVAMRTARSREEALSIADDLVGEIEAGELPNLD